MIYILFVLQDDFSEHLVKELGDTGAREEEKNTFIGWLCVKNIQ